LAWGARGSFNLQPEDARYSVELTLEWGEAEDEQMKIGAWVASKRKVLWQARFAGTVANRRDCCGVFIP
jgi:hypothetical protein